jgi:hypothetical protein
VSLLIYQFQADSLVDDKRVREPMEAALNNAAERLKDKPRTPLKTPYDEPIQALPDQPELGKLWSDLTRLRNDLAHGGMNSQPGDAESLRDRAKKMLPRLQALGHKFLSSGFNGDNST